MDPPYSVVEDYGSLLNQVDVQVGDEGVGLRRVRGDGAEPRNWSAKACTKVDPIILPNTRFYCTQAADGPAPPLRMFSGERYRSNACRGA